MSPETLRCLRHDGQTLELWRITARQCGQGRAAPAAAKLGAAAHARSGSDRECTRLQVAIQDARREQLDLLRAVDVPLDLARDRHRLGPDAPRQLGTLLDREIALDVHVALELSGDAHMSRTDDLTRDRDLGRNDRLRHVARRDATRRRRDVRGREVVLSLQCRFGNGGHDRCVLGWGGSGGGV